MANSKTHYQSDGGGITTVQPSTTAVNGVVIFPESGILATKQYVDDNTFNSQPILTGTTTFTAVTNNINLTNIVTALGLEIGDVIQISGATDSKNNSEFTVEVITDSDNVIVNQAHANKGTTKNVATRVSDTDVTVKLLAKWYNASDGLGQDWVNMTSSRVKATTYPNNTNRTIVVHARANVGTVTLTSNGVVIMSQNDPNINNQTNANGDITKGSNYIIDCTNTLEYVAERR